MSTNPYAAPKAAVADERTLVKGNFVPGGRGVDAGRGVSWIGESWNLFKKAPGLWIGMILVLFVIFFVLAFIPFLGSIATMVLGPVFTGGLMLGCQALDEGGELEFSHLFAGFQQKFGTLAAIGGLYLAGTIAVMVLVMVVTGASMFAVMGMGGGAEQADPMAVFATMGIAILIGLALMLPLFMAIWMAAPLAMLSEQSAFDALKGSFMGCLKNIVPFLLYSLVMILLAIVATLPIMLGWLVLGPMVAASVYASYRDIYYTT
jgi:uncharacterized membrane protein